jgi:hypothetical protein
VPQKAIHALLVSVQALWADNGHFSGVDFMQSQSSRPASIATRNGVTAGILVGILSLPVVALSAAGRSAGIGGGVEALLRLVLLAFAVVTFATLAFLASRRSGLLRSGVWVGLLGALLAAFIAICLGVVIVTLIGSQAPAVLPAARHATHAARAASLLVRGAILRLFLGGLIMLLAGLVAGLIGGALGRIGRPRAASADGDMRAPYVANPDATQTHNYSAPTPPMPPSAPPAQSYAGVYTPQPSYPTAPAYDDSAPTVVHESQE